MILHPLSAVIQSAEVTVLGVHEVKTEQKKQRRRRRRRNRKANVPRNEISSTSYGFYFDNHSDSSSTCATVSSDSSSNGSNFPTVESTEPQPLNHVTKENKYRPNNNNNKSTIKNELRPQEEHLLVPLEEQAKYLALDCEMVGVGTDGLHSSIARITLVSWDGSIVLDELVRQDQPVTDYRTFVSGITAQDLETASSNLTELRPHVQALLQDKVLIGHALKNDLRALGISHPWYNIRDTAKYEQFMQVRFDDGVLWPKKLKDLAKTRLSRDIQQPGVPHSSYEDAMAAMDLYKLVRRKWENVMEYKINKTKAMSKTASVQ